MNKTKEHSSKAENIAINIEKLQPKATHRFGKVNIDNITDNDYEAIKQIADATFSRRIKWNDQNIFNFVFNFISNKEPEYTYQARYKSLKIVINSNFCGKTTIKVTKGLTNQLIVDTFIPDKPMIRHGIRVGTTRSFMLYNLFKAVRYQVDGELIAC